MMILTRKAALTITLIGLVAVSHSVVFIRIAGEAPALMIALSRVALASAIFLPFGAIATRRLINLAPGALRRAVLSSAFAGLFLALHFASWITSLERVSIAESTVLVSLAPLWIALFDVISGRGIPTRGLLISIVLCLLGTLILVFDGAQRIDGDPFGLLLAASGGVFMALYLFSGRAARKVLPTTGYVTLCYGTASVLLLLAVVASEIPMMGYTPKTYAALLALGLVSQVIGHTSYNWTLSTLPPVFVAICLLGEPVLGALLGWLYIGEAIPPAAAGGGILILLGISFAIRTEMKRT